MQQIKIKATGEMINAYKLHNSTNNWYDYDNMGMHELPSATKANKKEFKPGEVIVLDSEL